MAENTKIEWAHHTFNPWEGCQKIGPGCDHCYAEARNARFGGGTAPNWGPGAPRRRTSASNWHQPIKWNAEAMRTGTRPRVFCASLADVFDNAVPPGWRSDLFDLIALTPNLDWLLLTKRIGNVPALLAQIEIEVLPPNVWLGATIINQAEAHRDVWRLLTVPATVHFLSMEPLLQHVHLGYLGWPSDGVPCARTGSSALLGCRWEDGRLVEQVRRLDWVIVGGESGPDARPMSPAWARSLRDQCAAAGVPFLFKQWGEWAPGEGKGAQENALITYVPPDGTWGQPQRTDARGAAMHRAGKKAAGRLLDGVQHDGVPT